MIVVLIYVFTIRAVMVTSGSGPVRIDRLPTGTRAFVGACFGSRGITVTGLRSKVFCGDCSIIFAGKRGMRFSGSKR